MPLDLSLARQTVEAVRISSDRDWIECAKQINPNEADEWLDEIERLQAIEQWATTVVRRNGCTPEMLQQGERLIGKLRQG